MKNKIKKVIKYTILSVRMITDAGKGKTILWLIAIILPPIVSFLKTVINSKMIDGILNLSTGGDISEPIFFLGVFIILTAGYNLFYKCQDRTFWILANSADEQMMLHMMKRSSALKQISFDSASRFDKVKDAIGSDLSLWNLNANLLDLITAIITIGGACIIVRNYDIKLIGFALLFSIPFFVISYFRRKFDTKTNVLLRRQNHEMNYYSNMLISASAAKEIRLFGIQNQVLSAWYNNIRKFQKEEERIAFFQMGFSIILIVTEILYSTLIYFICARSVICKTISIGDFYLYTSNLMLLLHTFNDISETIRSTLETSSEYDNFEKFTEETAAGERSGQKLFPVKPISIRFDHVSFGYEDKLVLKDIDFEWKSGENIALIGRNGSGKSTLIKLICGLYECTEGTIYINNVDVKMFSMRDIYKLFGIVYQNFCHYQLPIRTILASQRLEDINDDIALWEAFDRAECTEFKKQLSDGLDTPLGHEFENGIELSGGQWQKIAIARNYYGKRSLMLFDEPSASLDPKAEHKIIEDLLSKSKNANENGVLVISHRLSVGNLVDRIIYLENGRIIEQGSHNELMKNNGSYAKMYRTQASLYKEEVQEL